MLRITQTFKFKCYYIVLSIMSQFLRQFPDIFTPSVIF